MDSSVLTWYKHSALSLPPVGVSTSIGWALQPHGGSNCSSPHVYLSVGHDPTHQQLHPPWAHKSQIIANVNHISSSILLNMCIKPLYPSLVLKDIIQVCNTSLEEVTRHPIGLMSTRRGMFLERIKSKSCKWVRWMGIPRKKVE